MHLTSLNRALKSIEDEDQVDDVDVTMEDVDISQTENWVPEPEPKEVVSSDNVSEDAPPDSHELHKIPVLHESMIAPTSSKIHENQASAPPLWPSKLGASTANVYEVDMPFPPPWHHNVVYSISTYIYLAFNFGVIGLAAWFLQLLVKDIKSRIHLEAQEILAASNRCARDFIANECSSNVRRPALADYCHELEKCMDRDPNQVFRVNAFAKALAEALNAFFDPLSAKAVVMMAGLAIGIIYFANFVFGFVRARSLEGERIHIKWGERDRD